MTNPQPAQQVVYQQVVKAPSNGSAVTSLILGIVAIVIGIWSFVPILGIGAAFTSFIPALLAIIFGHVGLKNAARNGVGRGQAMTGLILGYVTLGIIVATTVFWIVAIAASGAAESVQQYS